jgi:hypothetical protein
VVRVTSGGGAAGGCQHEGRSGAEGTDSGAETETLVWKENDRESVYRSDGATSGDSRRGERGRFVAGDEVERFYANVTPQGECLIWTGRRTSDGAYGRFTDARGREVRAHRWAYQHRVGSIPAGHTLDHLIGPGEPCTSTLCVRAPGHLEAVTNAENLRRRHARRRATQARKEITPWPL